MSRDAKHQRMALTPPGSEIRIGAGQKVGVISTRCRARHDVPYSLRCIHEAGHQSQHEDKKGNRWQT